MVVRHLKGGHPLKFLASNLLASFVPFTTKNKPINATMGCEPREFVLALIECLAQHQNLQQRLC